MIPPNCAALPSSQPLWKEAKKLENDVREKVVLDKVIMPNTYCNFFKSRKALKPYTIVTHFQDLKKNSECLWVNFIEETLLLMLEHGKTFDLFPQKTLILAFEANSTASLFDLFFGY